MAEAQQLTDRQKTAVAFWVLVSMCLFVVLFERQYETIRIRWHSNAMFHSERQYAVQVEDAEFGADNTEVTLRILDQGNEPSFLKFQLHPFSPDPNVYLRLNDSDVKTLLRVGPDSKGATEHERQLMLYFEPASDPEAIRDLSLSFLDFPTVAINKTKPSFLSYTGAVVQSLCAAAVLALILVIAFGYVFRKVEDRSEAQPVKVTVLGPSKSNLGTSTKSTEGEDGVIFHMQNQWNDELVTQQLLSLQDRPSLLAHFVNSLVGRFIIGQNDKTAEKRTKLIKTVVNQLKATKDLRVALDDLEIHRLEREIRFKEEEIKHSDVLNKQEQQHQLQELRRSKEKLEVEVEIARLEQQKRSYAEHAGPSKSKPSREDLRQAKKLEIKHAEEEMAEAIFDITNGIPFDKLAVEQQERVMRVQNFYNDRQARLDQELASI